MSLVVVETQYDEPTSFEQMSAEEERLTPCLTARQATWQYSLLSKDRCRMICIYKALDAESVRTGYHTARVFFSRTWGGELLEPQNRQSQTSEISRVVLEAAYPALSPAEWAEIQSKLLHIFSQSGITGKAYRSLDRSTVVWELSGTEVEPIQEALNQADIRYNRIWTADLLNLETWASLSSAS
ncbi:DUF4242 domain-containing protein [Egbenema bharatensis]|uniref:DUF4242 domain-containing protein n=1 Tax=Egbenema bharatensis TaxID=3463334 RepID=UPI003A89D52D